MDVSTRVAVQTIVGSEADKGTRGVGRVVAALARYPTQAHLTIFHVIGRNERLRRAIDRLDGSPYVIVQYCLRSTQRPKTSDWIDIWEGARLVWSYYDLPALCTEDGVDASFNFYRSPLGIEPVFTPQPVDKQYTVMTHGDLSQGTKECIAATGRIVHLGPRLDAPGVRSYDDVPDEVVARLYSESQWVCGLRRVEGFELPAAEGLACGARPILYDQEHYRRWFGSHADYIREGRHDAVVAQLIETFANPRPVSDAEALWARLTFNWTAILCGFYEHL